MAIAAVDCFAIAANELQPIDGRQANKLSGSTSSGGGGSGTVQTNSSNTYGPGSTNTFNGPTAFSNITVNGSATFNGSVTNNGNFYSTNQFEIYLGSKAVFTATAPFSWSTYYTSGRVMFDAASDFYTDTAGHTVSVRPNSRTLNDDSNAAEVDWSLNGTVALGKNASSIVIANGLLSINASKYAQSALTPATSVGIDFSTSDVFTLSNATNVTFTTSNIAAGGSKSLIILNDSTARTVTWPAGWHAMGAPLPSGLSASKYLVVNIYATSTTDASCLVTTVAEQ